MKVFFIDNRDLLKIKTRKRL